MPRQAEWLQQLPAALEALKQVRTPVVDRAMLERLLGVHRRAAIRLMHRLGGFQAGRTFLIGRGDLVRELGRIAAGESFRQEAGRRQRLVNQLGEARRDLAARRIPIRTAPDVAYRELSGLPSTIRLAPGKLEIDCRDAHDLLRQLLELAQAIGNDFDRFEALVAARDQV